MAQNSLDAAVAASGSAVGLTRAFFVGATVGEASRAGVSTTATAGPAVEAPLAPGTFETGGGWVGSGAGTEAAGNEVGTGGSSPTSFSLFFESASTASTTTAIARRPPPRTKDEILFFVRVGGGAAAPAPFAITSPIRRPVVIVGDSESATGVAAAGIGGRAGTAVEPASAGRLPTGGETLTAAVGAIEVGVAGTARGATGGGGAGGGRTRL